MAKEMLYHYTKLQNVKGIIRNDAMHMYSFYFRKYAKDDYLWIKNYSKDIVEEICKENNWAYDADDLTIQPYFISFCEDCDSKYMWENYAENDHGVKFIFDKRFIKECVHVIPDIRGRNTKAIETTLPCIYIEDKDKLKEAILGNIERPELQEWDYFDRLRFLVSVIKQTKPYEEEKEYRHIHLYPIVFTANYNDGNFYIQDDNGPTDYKDMWVDMLFPKEMLLGIEMGPSTTKEDLTEVREHMKSVGLDPLKTKVFHYGSDKIE